MDDNPLLTMTRSRLVDEIPPLTDKSNALFETLCTLCSFHTCADLASFLFTDMFRELVNFEEIWIVFEIGLYHDHTITIEAIPTTEGIKFADTSLRNIFPNNIIEVKSEIDCENAIQYWVDCQH
ncbi:MAG: hypothetical protein VW862_02340 [Euryarchaeota archaeon]